MGTETTPLRRAMGGHAGGDRICRRLNFEFAYARHRPKINLRMSCRPEKTPAAPSAAANGPADSGMAPAMQGTRHPAERAASDHAASASSTQACPLLAAGAPGIVLADTRPRPRHPHRLPLQGIPQRRTDRQPIDIDQHWRDDLVIFRSAARFRSGRRLGRHGCVTSPTARRCRVAPDIDHRRRAFHDRWCFDAAAETRRRVRAIQITTRFRPCMARRCTSASRVIGIRTS